MQKLVAAISLVNRAGEITFGRIGAKDQNGDNKTEFISNQMEVPAELFHGTPPLVVQLCVSPPSGAGQAVM